MTTREDEILKLIKENPLITQNELADKLHITRPGVATHIHNLTKKGLIKGRGYLLDEEQFVAVIGGINMDILGIPNDELISQNSNPGRIIQNLGGAGRNIALALTKMNIPNDFISVYGDDLNGDKFVNNAREANMNLKYCQRIAGSHTSSFLYILDASGKKNIGIDDMQIYQEITPQFLEKHIDHINQARLCIIDTNIKKPAIEYIYKNCKVPIIAKTVSQNKNRRLLDGIENLDTLVTTEVELFQMLASYQPREFKDVKHAAKILIKKGVKRVIVFDIKSGLYSFSKEKDYYIKRIEASTINNNGSNASLTAALTYGIMQGFTWKNTLKYSYAASLINSQSNEAINPDLSVETIDEETAKLFK
ncbi:PfkB family carbohydrate kinase [Lactobacillus sp. YT155]|uniref:PfkB family carbohydrate kinase n=1 Tax=Lactobacillus sp. YT155 TaxID=3060955 RepID=UPI00265FE35E|nr:PfkB family carbohydrate kinase [Lactobacillus sp. YT155]MDO1605818.1 PfkB family carbohydrate kinase [Lactobacillus sp. YT155]